MNAIKKLEQELGVAPPLIMGVLNITPDSFSDGGEFADPNTAIKKAEELAQEGAKIIDIGAESTRPGSSAISADEEIARLSTIIKELSKDFFISVDTYKSETARYCLEHGARMINDVSALRADTKMGDVIREHDCYAVLMYSKEEDNHPHATDNVKDYQNVISEVAVFLNERVTYALKAGIAEDRIILDPGMGKFVSHAAKYSWELLRNLKELKTLIGNFPLLIGTSRKGFLSGSLASRDPISQLTAIKAVEKGAAIIRTHNVKMAAEFMLTTKKISS